MNLEAMNIKPKYTFDMLYVSPLTKKLGFDEQKLRTIYVEREQKRVRTGLEVIDMVVDALMTGRDPADIPWRQGIDYAKMSATMKLLTGMTIVEMRTLWRARVAGELLRYTELPLKEVMRRCGYTSAPSFSRLVSKTYGSSPLKLRKLSRERGDIGKFAL